MSETFPRKRWSLLVLRPQHPDEFIENLVDLDPAAVIDAASMQRRRLKQPPLDVEHYLAVLLRQGLVQTVKLLSRYRTII